MLRFTLMPQKWQSPLTLPQPQSIGLPKAMLVQSKIKVNVVHAGLSPPQALLSHPSQLPAELHLFLFLNSSSFHAHQPTKMPVAVVAGTTGLGTTLKSTVKRRALTTLTLLVPLLLMELATMTPQRLLLTLLLMSRSVKPTRKLNPLLL